MRRLVPDKNVMVTTGKHDIISHEKAYVRMDAGCVWVYLLEDGTRVGAAFTGPSRFAVDAIAETDVGAMGDSITGTLDGFQFYIGPVDLDQVSEAVSARHIEQKGFSNVESLIKAVEQAIEEEFNGDQTKIKIGKKEDSGFFMGMDSQKQNVILVLGDDGLVFTHGKNVFVLGKDSTVSVSKSGVAITNPDGKNLIVGKGGIVELDNFLDIGPIVTTAVSEAMKDLKGLKSLKSMRHDLGGWPFSWDSVDDFDWEE